MKRRGRHAVKFPSTDSFTDGDIFRIAEAFINRGKKKVKEFLSELDTPSGLKPGQHQIYPLLARAAQKKMIRLCVPNNQELENKLVKHFPLLKQDEITVVDAVNHSVDHVSSAAADYVFDQIQRLGGLLKGSAVGLGLGPGRATLDFCFHLSARLRSETPRKNLRLFAIAAGCLPETPEEAPVSFFNLFPDNVIESRIGLFSELLVRAKEFEEVKNHIGVTDAFTRKHEIDVVVSSMGDFQHEQDILRVFLERTSGVRQDIPLTWKGNVQFRPYTDSEAVDEMQVNPELWRAVTLFEISELRRLAETKDKHVILMARQSKPSLWTKHNALKPLLINANLKVFNHLVTDSVTAQALLSP
jgi:hypothetical protein